MKCFMKWIDFFVLGKKVKTQTIRQKLS